MSDAAADPEVELPLSKFVEELGYAGATKEQLMACGRRVADVYRSMHAGQNPKRRFDAAAGCEVYFYREIRDERCVMEGVKFYFEVGGKFGE